MAKGARPKNPAMNTEAIPANQEVGYSSNNPEPPQLKDSTTARTNDSDALHAAMEYINGHI